MYLAGVSTRQVDDISQLLWGDRMPSQTLSDKLKTRVRRDRRDGARGRWNPSTRTCSWTACGTSAPGAGSVENVSVLVAIGVNAEGHREVIGVAEGMREDAASWEQFVRCHDRTRSEGRAPGGRRPVRRTRLHGRTRCCPRRSTSGAWCISCATCSRRSPPDHREWASAALKAIFAMESRESALAKAGTGRRGDGVQEAQGRRQLPARGRRRDDDLPAGRSSRTEHRRRIRTNNMIERLNREIRRRTRVVGGFPDGNSALMLICARIRSRHRERMVDPPLPRHVPAR